MYNNIFVYKWSCCNKYHPLCKVNKYTSLLPNTCPVVFVERDLRWLQVVFKGRKQISSGGGRQPKRLQCSAKHLLLQTSCLCPFELYPLICPQLGLYWGYITVWKCRALCHGQSWKRRSWVWRAGGGMAAGGGFHSLERVFTDSKS